MTRLSPRVAGAGRAGPGILTVLAADDVSCGLRLVTLAGASLVGHAWTPGQEIEVRITPTVRRHYTPMTFDPHTGRCRILVQLLVPGPGTRWARRVAPGDEISVCGPYGGVRSLPPGRHCYLGDATALGAFRALLDHGAIESAGVLGAVEVPPLDADAARDVVPELAVLPHDGAPGAALSSWVRATLERPGATRPDACRLVGHANSLRRVRRQLVQAGVPRRTVGLTPYWATGRAGL